MKMTKKDLVVGFLASFVAVGHANESVGNYTRPGANGTLTSELRFWVWCGSSEMSNPGTHWSIENAFPAIRTDLRFPWRQAGQKPPAYGSWTHPSYYFFNYETPSWHQTKLDETNDPDNFDDSAHKWPQYAAWQTVDWVEYMEERLAGSEFNRTRFEYALMLQGAQGLAPPQDPFSHTEFENCWKLVRSPQDAVATSGDARADAANWFSMSGLEDASGWGKVYADEFHARLAARTDSSGGSLPPPTAFHLDYENVTDREVLFEYLDEASTDTRSSIELIDGELTLDEHLAVAPDTNSGAKIWNQSSRYQIWFYAIDKRVSEYAIWDGYLKHFETHYPSAEISNWLFVPGTCEYQYPMWQPDNGANIYETAIARYVPKHMTQAAPVLYPPNVAAQTAFGTVSEQLDRLGLTSTGSVEDDINLIWETMCKRRLDACVANGMSVVPWIAYRGYRNGTKYWETGQAITFSDQTYDAILDYAISLGINDFILWENTSGTSEYDWFDVISTANSYDLDYQDGTRTPRTPDYAALDALRVWTQCEDVDGDGDVDQDDANEILIAWVAANGEYDYRYDVDLDGDFDLEDVCAVRCAYFGHCSDLGQCP